MLRAQSRHAGSTLGTAVPKAHRSPQGAPHACHGTRSASPWSSQIKTQGHDFPGIWLQKGRAEFCLGLGLAPDGLRRPWPKCGFWRPMGTST